MKVLQSSQGSYQWFEDRKGKITGSRAKKVFSSNNLPFIDELISEIGTNGHEENFQNQEMLRGSLLEEKVRLIYSKMTGFEVEELGLCVNDNYEWMAVSPDGLIKKDGIFKKAIEIKCPKTNTHVRYIRENKIPNEYKHQIYQYFAVIEELESLDFISYDDRFLLKPFHKITIERKDIEVEIQDHVAALIKFRKKFDKYYDQIAF